MHALVSSPMLHNQYLAATYHIHGSLAKVNWYRFYIFMMIGFVVLALATKGLKFLWKYALGAFLWAVAYIVGVAIHNHDVQAHGNSTIHQPGVFNATINTSQTNWFTVTVVFAVILLVGSLLQIGGSGFRRNTYLNALVAMVLLGALFYLVTVWI